MLELILSIPDALVVYLLNIDISAKTAPTPTTPFNIEVQSMFPKSSHAEAITFKELAMITIPVADLIPIDEKLVLFKNNDISVITAPKLTIPLIIDVKSNPDKSLQALPKTLIANANAIIPVEPFIKDPPFFDKLDATLLIIPIIANIAVKEVIVCVISKLPIFFIANDKISIEVAIDAITVDDFIAELVKLPILEYNLHATNNCANNPPTAANDDPNLSESINDILTIEAAKIPIAVAILINISAFNLS